MCDPAKFSTSLSADATDLLRSLCKHGQQHLFDPWDPPGVHETEKQRFMDQLLHVDAHYPGGILQYIDNARRLLHQAREGHNPYDGFTPEQPDLTDLSAMDHTYDRMEALGAEHVDRLGVVLVAGGLGERLGHPGIKVDLPIEILEHTSYLQHYAACLLAMEARMPAPRPVPFVIMTSGDTHQPTLDSLRDHDYFGLRPEQVHLLQQQQVPALLDNDARLATTGPYQLQLKPHGHGDVHMLLHSSGLAARLRDQGIEHLAFIQDTNAQVFNALPAALGVSIDQHHAFNSLAVNRVPGEAVGGIARLVNDQQSLTLNIEYNQLDPLLRATLHPEGDVPGPNGFSFFPGNINVLLIRLDSYLRVLQDTRGIIAEFVNPKYDNPERTRFKKPARLETLMQDLPKSFGPDQKVGVTVFERRWCFSPNKNRREDAAAKHAADSPPESAATAESDFYLAGRIRAEAAGMEILPGPTQLIQGVPFTDGPRVLLRPSFGITLHEIRRKISGGHLSGSSTLILDGPDIHLDHLSLRDGAALVVHAVPGARVRLRGQRSGPPGFLLEQLPDAELNHPDTPAHLKMRGYRFVDQGVEILRFDQPGDYDLDIS